MVNFAAPSYNLSPGGRLSLSSGVAVQTADVVGGTTIYYVPYTHQGLGHLGLYLTAQIFLALDSNAGHTGYHQSGKIFDIFVDGSTGTPRLVTGPAWTNSTTRSAAIDQTTVPGLWSNTATMTTKFDTTASTYSAPAGSLLYVGSFYATANGQTTIQFRPAAAVGGANPIMGMDNAYNVISCSVQTIDSTVSWTYAVASWRNSNASASNRVNWLDGLGNTTATGFYYQLTNPGANGATLIGTDFDTTGAQPAFFAQMNGGSAVSAVPGPLICPCSAALGQGFHFAQASEQAAAGTITQFANSTTMVLIMYLEY